MIGGLIMRRANPLLRRFGTSAVRQSGHDTTGIVGSNLPFGIKNKYLLVLGFIIYCGSGLAAPFLIVRRGLLMQK